jgi:hypothetical protein
MRMTLKATVARISSMLRGWCGYFDQGPVITIYDLIHRYAAEAAERGPCLPFINVRHDIYLGCAHVRSSQAPPIESSGLAGTKALKILAAYVSSEALAHQGLRLSKEGRVGFCFLSRLPLGVLTSGPVTPPPGWVADGGSLAGNDISNSLESCRSSSFFVFRPSSSFLDFRSRSGLAILSSNRSEMAGK